jgi:Na+/proline symporter/signal transduction histidine kinase/CheY-like chemotaxis protein
LVPSWLALGAALLYISALFWIASYGDRRAMAMPVRQPRPTLYALALAIYCTSWTFFGSVGLAAVSGLDFLTIYIGPILILTLGAPLLRHIIALSKAERITSVADFLSARYGKNERVAALAALIAVVGVVPYIALQLKAVSSSVELFVEAPTVPLNPTFVADIAFLVAMAMAAFAVLFGTRTVDTSEHQDGLMLAVATESVVKLVAFIIVGCFVTFIMFDGFGDLFTQAAQVGALDVITGSINGGTFIAMTLLSAFAIILLPRQFHILVVENNHPGELSRARWLFPAYLLAINVFVVPIALAGQVLLGGQVEPDTYVLQLPMSVDAGAITLIGFVGGLSAATAMVIVASVALSIMISNDLIMPFIVRRRADGEPEELGRLVLNIRRVAIFAILLMSYLYYRAAAGTAALAEIGLLSFAAIAQMAPAFFLGLVWKRGTARGAVAGMLAGLCVWAYTLLVPNLIKAGALSPDLLVDGLFGLALLHPERLFGLTFDPLTHGVFWSLVANIAAYFIVSIARQPEAIERLQAQVFVPSDLTPTPALRMSRTRVTFAELQGVVARYLGEQRTDRSFQRFARERGEPIKSHGEADIHALRFAEQLLASAIGAASSRLVMTLMLRRHQTSSREAMKLLDEASSAIQYNRDLLQTALDQVRQGISVFDRDLNLICWNRQFRDLLNLPAEFGQVGTSLHTILRHNAERGAFGKGSPSGQVAERVERMVVDMSTFTETLQPSGLVLEVRTNPMPDGGIVTTYTDITDRERAAEELAQINEELEQRVRERTEELTRVNQELELARQVAENANISKTRFLAAASHDILQPLNAARLYASTLNETEMPPDATKYAANIDRSLEAVEDILGALLDISRLDAGAMKPEPSVFALQELFEQLQVEFGPAAAEKGLSLRFVKTSVMVRSDRKLLKRLLQNLVSNAVKYTRSGGVAIGMRRDGQGSAKSGYRVAVYDTGIGMGRREQRQVFDEFKRLDDGARTAGGLGLGLSIVDRIAGVLGLSVSIASQPGAGSCFSVTVPHVARASVDAAMAIENAKAARPSRAHQTDLTGVIVCCIDNEPTILEGMSGLLSRWGAVAVTGATAAEVGKALQRRGAVPEMVLADYHLDDGTGIEAVKELRWKFGAGLPAVLVTADRSVEMQERAEAAGIAILNKPVKPAALRAMVAQFRAVPEAAE